MNLRNTFFILLIILFFLTQNSFTQNALFHGLGDFPEGSFNSSAQGISDDGSVVIGYGTTESGEQAFYWTETSGMVSLENLPDKSFKKSWANSVSADGKVIVGYGDPAGSGWNTYKGFIWTISDGMKEIGSLDSSTRFMAFSANADGSVVVGDGGPEAFRWTQESGIEGLGILPNRTNSRAIGISDDASVIIGQSYSLPAWNDEDGFIWTKNGGMRAMSSLTGGKYCMLLTISPDGSVAAGTINSSSTYPAFYWTESKGMVTIGHLPGRNTTHPTDMTPFGRIIVGGSFSGPTSGEAFIWDSTNGMRSLKTVLQTEYGLDLTGWTLQNASGITPDGDVIVGYGINPEGNKEAFRVILDTLLLTPGEIDYLGQTPPGDEPVIFAPEIVSINGRYEYGLSISPDGNEIFFTADTPGDGLSVIKKVNGQWSESQTANLRGNNSWEFEAFYSVDGQKLFFTSQTNNISKFWFANKTASGWSNPEYLDSPVNNTPVMWCTFTSDETMYYGNNNNWKIHRAKLIDEKYSAIETLDFNGTHPSVAADESYFLFNSNQYGGYGKNDIFIVFKKADNTWSDPINLGNKINTSYGETCASLSPDGKYIFFSRYNEPEEKCNIYWVSSSVIDSLKKSITGIGKIYELPDRINLYQNYPNPFNPHTVISYLLPVSSDVKLKIYNILGQEVKTLIDKFQNSGEYTITWNATDNTNNPVSSGVYLYRIQSNEMSVQRKMTLLR